MPTLSPLAQQMQRVSPDASGNFVILNLPWPSQNIRFMTSLPPQYYVKEIRVGGAPSPDRTIPLLPGAPQRVEIVLEDQAPSVSGIVIDGDKTVSDARIQMVRLSGTPYAQSAVSGPDGKFQIAPLEPGDCRITYTAWESRRAGEAYPVPG
jgi:hypothetical protein